MPVATLQASASCHNNNHLLKLKVLTEIRKTMEMVIAMKMVKTMKMEMEMVKTMKMEMKMMITQNPLLMEKVLSSLFYDFPL